MQPEERSEKILALKPDVIYHAGMISRSAPHALLFQDLQGEAWIGAIQGVDRFREDGGANLRTFARAQMLGRMRDYVRRIDPLTRGQRQAEKAGKFAQPVHVPLSPWLQDVRNEAAVSRIEQRLYLNRLFVVAGLTEREARFLRLRFFADVTQHEIAALHGIHESRASQIVNGALTKLRQAATV